MERNFKQWNLQMIMYKWVIMMFDLVVFVFVYEMLGAFADSTCLSSDGWRAKLATPCIITC